MGSVAGEEHPPVPEPGSDHGPSRPTGLVHDLEVERPSDGVEHRLLRVEGLPIGAWRHPDVEQPLVGPINGDEHGVADESQHPAGDVGGQLAELR